MPNSVYPGNSSLAPEIQQRVQGTFRQTLDLAGKGSLKEAQLGCDFVLRLDPDFAPARRLADQLASASGPLDVSAFLDEPQPPAAGQWIGEDDLELPELPLLPEFGMDPSDLRVQLEDLVTRRQFADALRLAESESAAIQSDPELQQLVEQAQGAMEAEPYIRPFLESARSAARSGQRDEMEGALRKVAALDASHPEIEEIRRLLGSVGPSLSSPFAADFGSSGFSFDSAVAAVGASGDARIDELMRDGEQAFDRGEFQNAIDAWSRIFLIDIDHREAAQRIESARRLKAEREREVEELFHEAAARFDAGDREGARAGFERVLALAPSYYAAREYLDRLALEPGSGGVTGFERDPASSAPSAAGRGAAGEAHGRGDLKQEVFVPPDPGEEGGSRNAAVGQRVAVAAKRGAAPGGKLFLMIGGAVLIIVVAAGWFLWSSRERLFPNSNPTPTPPAASVDPITRARALHAEGKTALAIAQLRRLPPDSPVQAEARTLISQWESVAEGKKPAAGAPAPEVNARREALLAAARTALMEGENIRAALLFDQAAALAALEPEAATLATQARERCSSLTAEMDLFKRGEWEYLLNNLWRKRDADPKNRDVARLMVDSYYNLGVRDLQRGDAAAAADKFREAASIDGSDREIQRLSAFARTYQERSEDLLARIFVKYLPVR